MADDQKINLELVKLNLSEVGITENVTYCSDGNIAVVGGHIAKSGYNDGLKSLRIFDRCARPRVLMWTLRVPVLISGFAEDSAAEPTPLWNGLP